MIDRTKGIVSPKNKPVDHYYFVKIEDKVNKSQIEIDPSRLKIHSLRYEEIIRKNKEELRRKRSLAPLMTKD
jgi:hypothetical protein